MSLLERVLDLLFPPRETERTVRNMAPDALLGMVALREVPLGTVRATALLPYRDVVKAAIIEAKYHDNQDAQKGLGEVLAEYLLELASEEAGLSGKLALVPVPLSPERLRERGYNQVERICAVAMARLASSFTLMPDALTRVRDTDPQTGLKGYARRENLREAFATSPELDTTYTYIVVDDVLTTGATIKAAIAALQAAGASVIPLALAH